MKRIVLLVLGVASGIWMLRDLSPSAKAEEAGAVKVVRYTVLVQDDSSDSETDDPDLAPPSATIDSNDRAALGRWATGLLGPLVKKTTDAPKPAATATVTTTILDAPKTDDSAKQRTEQVAQRNPTAATPAPATPITSAESPSDKPAEEPATKPDDAEKPAVTIASPNDDVVTDETPAATATPTAEALDNTTDPLPQTIAPTFVPVAPVRPPLTPELTALSQKVRYALWMFQHQRLLNTGTNASWDVMHRIVSYGADTEVLRDGPGGEPVNAIGWLLWGGRCNSQPLLILKGGQPYAQVGVGVQGHNGQFLGMLAQSHVRPDSPFELQGRQFTVRDMIEQEKLSCEANTELTFELIALTHYLKSDDGWTARTGEQWSISRLIAEEIKQPINGAACGGSHRLFGLSAAYKMRIAEGKPVDGEFLRAQKYIRAYQSYALNSIHNRDGSFSTDWFRRPADNGDLDRKIQTTGHILEWLVFSLEDNQLRDPRVVRSVDFLATQLASHPNRAWSVGPLGHALHAMAIYQSRVFVQSSPQPMQQQTASARAYLGRAVTRTASKPVFSPLPPQPKANPASPAARPRMTRPSIGTANSAAATAELQGPDLGITR